MPDRSGGTNVSEKFREDSAKIQADQNFSTRRLKIGGAAHRIASYTAQFFAGNEVGVQ